MSVFDVIIIGAGLSGLSALASLDKRHKSLVIEYGKVASERKHTDSNDLGIGLGGAGLFSDGKFSYFPAGTNAYKLNNFNCLRDAHKWVETIMMNCGIETIDFDNLDLKKEVEKSSLLEKKYPSFYASLEQRRELMADLSKIAEGSELLTNTEVVKIKKQNGVYVVAARSQITGLTEEYHAKNIILSSGRFGILDLKGKIDASLSLPYDYIRAEFGIRIESKKDIGFLSRKDLPDVKYIWKKEFGEIRTFCTCRDGEIWNIPYQNGISALSGRSDGPKSGYSNFGFLVRVTERSLGGKVLSQLTSNEELANGKAICQPLPGFLKKGENKKGISAMQFNELARKRPWYPQESFVLGDIRDILGNECSELLAHAVHHLLEISPDLYSDDVYMILPSIEGGGDYLVTDNNLKVEGENIWVAGDANGHFRGIIPALISGYYAGEQLNEKIAL